MDFNFSKDKKKKYLQVFILILIFGLLLRSMTFDPYARWSDEIFYCASGAQNSGNGDFFQYKTNGEPISSGMFNSGRANYVKTHFLKPGQNMTEHRLTLLYPTVILPLSFYLFGASYEVGEIMSILAWALTMLAIFIFLPKIYGRKITLIVLFLFAVNPLGWLLSNHAMYESWLVFFSLTGVLIFFVGVKEKKYKLAALSGIFTGLAAYTMITGWFLIAPLTLYLIYLTLKNRYNFKINFTFFIIFIIGFTVIMSPYFHSNFVKYGIPFHPYFIPSTFTHDFEETYSIPEGASFAKIRMFINSMFGHVAMFKELIIRILTYPLSCMAFLGMYCAFKSRKERDIFLLLMASSVLVFLVYKAWEVRFIYILLPYFIILSALGMEKFTDKILQEYNRVGLYVKLYFAFGVFLVLFSFLLMALFPMKDISLDEIDGTLILISLILSFALLLYVKKQRKISKGRFLVLFLIIILLTTSSTRLYYSYGFDNYEAQVIPHYISDHMKGKINEDDKVLINMRKSWSMRFVSNISELYTMPANLTKTNATGIIKTAREKNIRYIVIDHYSRNPRYDQNVRDDLVNNLPDGWSVETLTMHHYKVPQGTWQNPFTKILKHIHYAINPALKEEVVVATIIKTK